MAMLRLSVLVCIAVVFAAVAVELAAATDHTVGSPNGSWDLSTNMGEWASSQTFLVGDNLVFQYGPNHDVAEVDQADYDACQTGNAINVYTGGSTSIPLTAPGKRFFLCATPGHCAQGMKVEIDTVGATSPPPKSPASPPPNPPASPPPESPVSPPPESPVSLPPESPVSPPPASPVSPPPATPAIPPTPKSAPSPVSTPPPAEPPKSSARRGSTSLMTLVIGWFAGVMILLAI